MPSINSKKNNQSEIKSRLFISQCKELLYAGNSISAIAKKTGKSYRHTKNICDQINRDDENLTKEPK